jgi:hypothetical protein
MTSDPATLQRGHALSREAFPTRPRAMLLTFARIDLRRNILPSSDRLVFRHTKTATLRSP